MSWTYTGNQTNVNGDEKCPGCPLAGNVGFVCVQGHLQQQICVPLVRTGNTFAIYRPKNVAAYQSHASLTPIHQDCYIDGDAEAHS